MYKRVLTAGLILTIFLSGCTAEPEVKKEYKDTPKSYIGNTEYSKEELEQLIGDTEYEKNYASVNSAILEEAMNKLATKETKEEVESTLEEYKDMNEDKEFEELTAKELESFKRTTTMNIELQKYYDKYLTYNKKEEEKEWETNPQTGFYMQVILNPNLTESEREEIDKELVKELDKLDDEEKSIDFVMSYGEEGVKEADNKKLKNKITVDVLPLNKYTVDGIFDTAMLLKKFKYEAIGKEKYRGYLMKLTSKKMDRAEFEESRKTMRLNKSNLINTKDFLLKLDKEESKIGFNELVREEIKKDWVNK